MKYENLSPEKKAKADAIRTEVEELRRRLVAKKAATEALQEKDEGKFIMGMSPSPVVRHELCSEGDQRKSQAYADKHYPQDGSCLDGISEISFTIEDAKVAGKDTCRESAVVVWERLVQLLRRELTTAEAVLQLAQKIHSDAEARALEEFLYESCPKGYRPLFRINS